MYVATKTADLDDFGTTKINKTLYHADMEMFRENGRPITGAQYHRIQNGPVPKHIPVAERNLVEKEALEIDKSVAAHKRIARREPNMDLFSENEIKIVDAQIERLMGDTSAKVSEDSHDIRWHAVSHQSLIPYEFAFLSGEATEKDKSDAAELAVELGW
ncbi:Panacea domain-containing protein [Sulfitobacter sp. S190]|uniref:Panacea domain-containing protein n=1 Tax=Sulfitobacter sp. S190 TaxID=2867022 RepID=UPI0021A5C6B5|nr:Panacea domain-containing protein [Sulfitobacter sp. S190]UWR23455.1 SocA family protein [Sulfitobacter sp. S190]